MIPIYIYVEYISFNLLKQGFKQDLDLLQCKYQELDTAFNTSQVIIP